MKNYSLSIILTLLVGSLLSGCATNNYDNNYSYENPRDREVNKVIADEMNSLSDADIAQINKLK